MIIRAFYFKGGGVGMVVSQPDENGIPQPTITKTVFEDDPELVAWVAAGNTITPYPPSAADLAAMDRDTVEETFTVHSLMRAVLKDRFDVENRIRVLEGRPAITVAQFKTALANRIRGA